MTASPLAPASGFGTAGWLPAQLTAAHTPKARSNHFWRATPAMQMHWLHRGIVLLLCELTD